jgi:hypothetical protein
LPAKQSRNAQSAKKSDAAKARVLEAGRRPGALVGKGHELLRMLRVKNFSSSCFGDTEQEVASEPYLVRCGSLAFV